MYIIKHLYSYAVVPSVPEFQGAKKLTIYLAECYHSPIIYLSGIEGTTTNEIRQEVSPGDLHTQKIPNGIVAFAEDGEDHAYNKKFAISCIILCIFLVAINCSDKTQPASAAYSTDSEVFTFYLATKMFQWL